MTLISMCDFSGFPWLLLWWLLPFLLGLLLGWLLWGKFKKLLEEKEMAYGNLELELGNVKAELEECRRNGNQAKNDIISLRAQIDEMSASGSTVASAAAAMPSTKPKTTSKKAPKKTTSDTSIYAAFKSDQLQVVEGIGPKMEEVLKSKGIATWADLADKSPADLRTLLDSYGSKYKIIDPATWSEQAALARDGNWDQLINRQKQLSGGTLEVSSATDSKVEKMLIKMGVLKRYKKDDLKAIEGIGPKIASLLQNAGIDTWQKLSVAPVSDLQKILSDAGSRYQLADPGTWPRQAEYAANGQWKELEEYQDFLNGGREA